MEPTIEAGRDREGGASQPLGPVVQIDEGRIQAHLDEVVRLRHVAATKWGTKGYLQMDRLAEIVAIA